MSQVIKIFVGASTAGKPVFEEVHVDPVGTQFRLLQSPGLALGLAAGDLVEVDDSGMYRVVARGGNICLQVYGGEFLQALEDELTVELSKYDGVLDGKSNRQLVYTVPVSAGFESIEMVLNNAVARCPGAEWYYGNVYDPEDGVTPLNWWKPLD